MNDPYGLGNPNPGQPFGAGQPPFGGHAPPPPPGQPGYGQPGYGQPGYGQGYAGQAPPPPGPQGYVSYGQGVAPPSMYTPNPDFTHASEWRKLEDDAQLWLIVGAVGFWFGFGWITGPLAWYNGSKIRGQYRALGHHPCASANWARGIGIASTLIYLIGVVAVVLAALAFVGVFMSL